MFAPTWLPDGYVFDTGHAGPDPKGSARATLIYTVERRRFVTFIEFPDPPRERTRSTGGRSVDRGERWVAISDVTEAEGVRISRASIDGTGILIRARLSADELLDVAFSLEPVRGSQRVLVDSLDREPRMCGHRTNESVRRSDRVYGASATHRLRSSPMPSMRLVTTCPGCRKIGGVRAKPTPAGVPVRITSPGRSVRIVLT